MRLVAVMLLIACMLQGSSFSRVYSSFESRGHQEFDWSDCRAWSLLLSIPPIYSRPCLSRIRTLPLRSAQQFSVDMRCCPKYSRQSPLLLQVYCWDILAIIGCGCLLLIEVLRRAPCATCAEWLPGNCDGTQQPLGRKALRIKA